MPDKETTYKERKLICRWEVGQELQDLMLTTADDTDVKYPQVISFFQQEVDILLPAHWQKEDGREWCLDFQTCLGIEWCSDCQTCLEMENRTWLTNGSNDIPSA